jgi:hypothetical protein
MGPEQQRDDGGTRKGQVAYCMWQSGCGPKIVAFFHRHDVSTGPSELSSAPTTMRFSILISKLQNREASQKAFCMFFF